MPIISVPASTGRTKPRIAYDNILRYAPGGYSVVGGEASGHNVEFAFDWRQDTSWKPTAGSSANAIVAIPGVARPANYLAFYATDIADHGGTVYLEYSADTVTWHEATHVVPVTRAPVYVTFATITALYWRVRVDCGTACELGIISFGMDFTCDRGVWVGFDPPELADDSEVTNSTSETGAFLGRSVRRTAALVNFQLDPVAQSWVRSTWMPFRNHALLRPFFMLWNQDDYPNAAAFCWTDGKLPHPSIKKTDYMTVGLHFQCLTA